MGTPKIQNGTVKMIAHRGLSGLERENTCAAYIAAGNRASYYGIETDIHRTKDGKFVTIHDGDLKRVSGENIEVETSDTALIQSVILYDEWGGKSRLDYRVPLLENYIRVCKKYDKIAILELKSDFSNEEIEHIIRILKEEQYLEGTVFISFLHENLLKVRSFLPEQRCQQLLGEYNQEFIDVLGKLKMDIDIAFTAMTKERVDYCHSLGLEVNCWTVDNPQDAERLVEWGVDYITTNILEAAD